MKKTLCKSLVFVLIFVLTVIAAEKIMNQGHENMTMEIAPADFPLIVMEQDGETYNELHGYKNTMNTAYLKENVTVLGEDRNIGFYIDTYGTKIDAVAVEVRSIDGERLIEKSELENYEITDNRIYHTMQLKDLIEKDTEYLLVFEIKIKETDVKYYGRIVWGDQYHFAEKAEFVKDFHERLFDKEAAREIAKYLEPDSKLEDNKSFYRVNIHSSFRQITYGDLKVSQETQPVLMLRDITAQLGSFLMDFIVSTDDGKGNKTYYRVEEYYRVWYSSEVQYLLDYRRTMVQIPEAENMYANDKLLLGITDWDVQMEENDDGNVVAFVNADRLFSYNVTANSLSEIFSFISENSFDRRELYHQHAIRILDVTEGGNVEFAVYGYMNRGRHEGEVGIQLYLYDNTRNTIEEIVYIPYDKTYDILQAEMEQLLYLNREQKLFLFMENKVYSINLADRTYVILTGIEQDGMLQVSEDRRILVSLVTENAEDLNHCQSINIRNLGNETEKRITVSEGESIRPLGFMGEDIIYGVARNEDIRTENTGRVFFPMYKLCISDFNGNLLKEYRQENIYITGCSVEDNQITIEREKRSENGTYSLIEEDHITNNIESVSGKNKVVTADIDKYERYVQIQTRNRIDDKTIKFLTPKEVVFEGGRELEIETEESDRFYVYGALGVERIFNSVASAVIYAEKVDGAVIDGDGKTVWSYGSRSTRNQIMAIKEESVGDGTGSIAVCLDTVLKYEGVVGNSEYLLNRGKSVTEILKSYLEDYRILDLTGCSLNAVLYYVNQDIPVLALLKDGEAVLITGFNSSEIVIMDPLTGRLYKRSINATIEWLEQNDNCFITYRK